MYRRMEYKKRTGIKINGFGQPVKEEEKKKKAVTGNTTVVKKDNYTKINTYKSTGTLIYDKNLLNRIENRIILKK